MDSQELPDIAVFDFDGTITRADTFNDFLIWRFGAHRFCAAMLCASPLIALYVLRLARNDLPKEFLFRWFFRGCPENAFNQLCENYALARIGGVVRNGALDRIKWHLSQGHHLVVNSASIANWITPWARANGFAQVIATEIEVKGGFLTGSFSTPCCYGEEKLVRLHAQYPVGTYSKIHAYGDSRGDAALLAAADYPAYKAFH